MYIDTHCHYDLDYFNNGRFRLLALLKEKAGIGQVIMPAILAESNENMRRKTDTASYPELLDDTGITADQLPKIWYAAGVHPTRVWGKHTASEGQWEKWIREAAGRPDTVAIGETGFDYHYEMDEDMLARQHMWFEKQLQIAEEYSLPLVLHIRMASENALEVLRRYALADGGVVHCFTEGWKMAQEFLGLGLMLGIGGSITLPWMEGLREAVKKMPLDRLLLETDAPYVRPAWELEDVDGTWQGWKDTDGVWEPWEGCNTSGNIPKIAQVVADIKGIPVEEVREQANANAARLFRLDPG